MQNPIFQPNGPAWRSRWSANPDLLKLGDKYFLYYRGNNGKLDQIGVATIPVARFDAKTWDEYSENPVIRSGGEASFDYSILDPSVVEVNGKIFMYYTAYDVGGQIRIGLSVSSDGFHFDKVSSPILIGGGGPEVVYRAGVFYLFYVFVDPNGFSIKLATSFDGIQYTTWGTVLAPGTKDAWDGRSITTPRIFLENGVYNMIYAGSDDTLDEPRYFGLATSHNLTDWTKFSGNPIFGRGAKGAWDGALIWFGTTEKINGKYYMWYEGSRTRYSEGATSQVGYAVIR